MKGRPPTATLVLVHGTLEVEPPWLERLSAKKGVTMKRDVLMLAGAMLAGLVGGARSTQFFTREEVNGNKKASRRDPGGFWRRPGSLYDYEPLAIVDNFLHSLKRLFALYLKPFHKGWDLFLCSNAHVPGNLQKRGGVYVGRVGRESVSYYLVVTNQ